MSTMQNVLATEKEKQPVAAAVEDRFDKQTTERTPVPRLAYSMEETAEALGVSYITVWRLVQRGLLKSSTALRHKLIPVSEIERFLKTTSK